MSRPSLLPRVVASDSLKLRVFSSLVLGSVALASAYFGGPFFAGVIAFLVIVMCYEWARMIDGADLTPIFYGLAVGAVATMICAAAGYYPFAYLACAASALFAAVAGFRTRASDNAQNHKSPIGRSGWAALGALYFVAPSVAFLWLRAEVENGRALTFMLFAIVWSADIGAYFLGRMLGGPQLSSALSPAKTWSGAIGGITFGATAGVIAATAIYGSGNLGSYALLGGSLGLVSILGDLVESGFKRFFGVKDMSGVIPGHGGVLDRLDGMIFATTSVALVIYGQILVHELGF